MRGPLPRSVLLLAMVLALPSAHAQFTLPVPASYQNSVFQYRLGQGTRLNPPMYVVNGFVWNPSADLTLGWSCGKFDPAAALRASLDRVVQGAEQFVNDMVMAANAVVMDLPLIVLQRIAPDAYNVLQNATAELRAGIRWSTKDCRDMEQEMSRGDDPLAQWAQVSVGNHWKVVIGTEPDITMAQKQVDQAGGEKGIPWVGGDAGGVGQPPIQPVTVAAKAGVNILLGRSDPEDSAALPADSPYRALWDTPDEVAAFARQVLGEWTLSTYSGGPQTRQPPQSIYVERHQETERLTTELIDLLNTPGYDELRYQSASAGGTALNPEVIAALRRIGQDSEAAQELAVQRLAQSLANARLYQKLVALREMISAAENVPEIGATGPALKVIRHKAALIDAHLKQLQFEESAPQANDMILAILQKGHAMEHARDDQIPAWPTPAVGRR